MILLRPYSICFSERSTGWVSRIGRTFAWAYIAVELAKM